MQKYEEIIAEVVQELFDVSAEIKLTRPEPKFGDYATNVALTIAGKAGQNPVVNDGGVAAGRPREIAEEIAEKLRDLSSSDLIRGTSKKEIAKSDESFDWIPGQAQNDNGDKIFSSVDIAGPGFINMTISAKHLAAELESLNKEIQPESGEFAGQTVVTEYSDPNPFKILHVGHFYTSVVGDALSNLIEAAGGEVHRTNYGGDVGLHAAKTMWSIVRNLGGELPEKLSGVPEKDRAEWLAARYVEGNTAYENDETAAGEIKLLNKRIYELQEKQDRETPFAQIYWACRQWSYDSFKEFYARVGIEFEKYYPESAVASLGKKTVLENVGKVYEKSAESDAIIFDGEKFGLHTRVFINREGLPTYEAKDVGLSLTKWTDYHFDKSIIITGSEQQEYMQVVLKSIEQFRPYLVEKTYHFTNGLVKLPGGVKISSRTGNGIRAGEAINLTADAQESAQGNRNMTTILGAIKYAFLKSRVGSDVVFDPATSVSLTGNSGPYVQYAAVRVNKILRDNNMAINPNNLRIEKRTCVGAFIFSSDDKVLLGYNRNGGAFSGKLSVPGGGIDEGETAKAAVIRETLEEVGIDILKETNAKVERTHEAFAGTEKTLRDSGERIWADMKLIDFSVYLGKPAGEVLLSNSDAEFGETKWLTREDLAAMNSDEFCEPTLDSLRHLGWLPPEDYDYAAEKTLILKLLDYPEVLRVAAHEFEPHRIATYVYELARELNRYYETTPVATSSVAADVKTARLKLLQKISRVFKHSLGILGIEIPEKM